MLKLLLTLIGALVLGGVGTIFVWSTLNLVLRGEASWQRATLAVLVVVALLGLLLLVMRVVRHLEEPR
jgi:hypothetical protein